MANPYKQEWRTTAAAKGRDMGVRNDWMPARAIKIAETDPERESYSMPTQNQPQMPENKHGPGYNNDTGGWVHGAGESGEGKPGFDHSKKSG
jgi:hypothetical protein